MTRRWACRGRTKSCELEGEAWTRIGGSLDRRGIDGKRAELLARSLARFRSAFRDGQGSWPEDAARSFGPRRHHHPDLCRPCRCRDFGISSKQGIPGREAAEKQEIKAMDPFSTLTLPLKEGEI
ncbi:hypothetical protein MPTK1_6g06240 [Marchantia polymorpha subsp. ruderalis]|uniref:Uncharacterized protein n=2 Tax=Marchantia polymorpha TaxID=3197 RepID=A0AAF6BP46_MARPO|nr:hypothetical protein MARPO_0097s0020 [Marchantia polymorpha]BBN13780.1 hypothetical protein Mp_6g06240 [Marchantia polymorpha subsp. ruderalis]|eukprot:PTQ32534.1 hypothetical protein MARPO_0097s0020 [Marchantia polymorpha]